jgi:hypothetical protein
VGWYGPLGFAALVVVGAAFASPAKGGGEPLADRLVAGSADATSLCRGPGPPQSASGLFRILLRRDISHAQLKRFEISGLVVVILFALAPYLGFLEPLVGAIDRAIGAMSNRLVILFLHPLSDFDYGDPFGRLVTYVILIMLPAILLTALLCGLALAGALVWRREA